MAKARGNRAPRNRKGTCRGIKGHPRMSEIRGPHKRSAPGNGPFKKNGKKNPRRCAKGKFSSSGKSFAYDRTKSGVTKFKKDCTLSNGKLINVQSSDFCISRKKGATKKLRMRSCLNKDLKVVAAKKDGGCRKGSNRGDVRFKAYKKKSRSKAKGAANRGRRFAANRSRRCCC